MLVPLVKAYNGSIRLAVLTHGPGALIANVFYKLLDSIFRRRNAGAQALYQWLTRVTG